MNMKLKTSFFTVQMVILTTTTFHVVVAYFQVAKTGRYEYDDIDEPHRFISSEDDIPLMDKGLIAVADKTAEFYASAYGTGKYIPGMSTDR